MTHALTSRAHRSQGLFLAALALVAVACTLLGVWQVQRLAWKTALIERVEARVRAPPSAAPGPGRWEGLSRDADEYRRLLVRGVFEHALETRVQAVTALGPGYWILTPLRTDQGFTVLINRGFMPSDAVASGARLEAEAGGMQTVIGLLRITEPHGAFLRANDPAHERWRSRDVAAIGAHRDLERLAPYFIDAEAGSSEWPRGGLTVLRFANNHFVYAVTWFALAGGAIWGLLLVLRRGRCRSDG